MTDDTQCSLSFQPSFALRTRISSPEVNGTYTKASTWIAGYAVLVQENEESVIV
jgi:hypothetical protein